jgi:hypothetical protein
MRYLILISVLAFVLMLEGCSHDRRIIYRSTCPDGSTEIQVAEYSRFPVQPSEVVELQLSANEGKKVVKSWKAKSLDMYPCFVAAAWSQDSSKVVVLFLNCYSLAEVVAFDARSYRAIDVAEMKPVLAAQIRTEYSLPDNVSDPIAWATKSDEARILFGKKQGR